MNILRSEDGQDVAEYAVVIALILVVMLATIHLIGAHASSTFSQVGSAIQ